ncbi:FtsX-like permease family protein [uncultured Eubacterium sp.]|uniref:FtsX-like permease family protein n=1 Tax=uncultured Eubacterium sp. TaxID=165185 RepID=UPI0025CF952F|nr:FtsX-like permease family protein [uncultured Eubacterium sp.]
MFAGLSAGCRDLRASADRYYDDQDLYDIKVQSTLGLTNEDVAALSKVDGISEVHGAYSETALVQAGGLQQKAEVTLLDINGLSQPRLLKGALPKKASEIAVSQNYCTDADKKIGDKVTLTAQNADTGENTSALKQHEYTITAVMQDATDLVADDGAVSFRSSQSAKYFFYVTADALNNEVYSSIELRVEGAKELSCFSEEYQNKVASVKKRIEKEIKTDREKARYDKIVGEATATLQDARDEADTKFAEADDKIAEARAELEDGKLQLTSGWKQLQDGIQQLKQQKQKASEQFLQGYMKISDGYKQLTSGEAQLNDGKAELNTHQEQLEQGETALKQQKMAAMQELSDAKAQLTAGKDQATSGKNQILTQISAVKGQLGTVWPESSWNDYQTSVESGQTDAAMRQSFQTELQQTIDDMTAILDAQIAQLDPTTEDYDIQKNSLENQRTQLQQIPNGMSVLETQYETVQGTLLQLEAQEAVLQEKQQEAAQQFSDSETQLAAQKQQLQSAVQQLSAQEQKLISARQELDAGLAELRAQEQNANAQFAKADREIQANTEKLNQSQKELEDGTAELEEQMLTLEEERTKAYDEIANAQADIDAIDMAKWYVQDRSSIGSYSTIQSDADSIETIGNVFPILFLSVAILISLTTITRLVEEERGQIGIYKALGFSDTHVYGKYLIYTLSACICGGLLGDIGGFILLPKFLFIVFEVMYKIPSYLFLFHWGYGISGILLFAAGMLIAAVCACHSELRQCPAALMRPKAPKAGSRVFLEKIPFLWKRLSFLNKVTFRNLFRYKKRLIMTISGILGCTALLVVGMAIKNSVTDLMPKQYNHIYRYDLMAVVMSDDYGTFTDQIDSDSNISDYLGLQMDTVQVRNTAHTMEETVPLYVIPDDASITDYINLEGLDGKEEELDDEDIFVTQNLSEVMGFTTGDTIEIQNSTMEESSFSVVGILHNYLGNAIYMRQSRYEELLGDYAPNTVLAHLSDTCKDPVSYADTLSRESDVVSCNSVQAMRDEFSKSFSLINCVVVLVTALAAGLAFVVLFTLATTNISERERELATIKVLGFFDKEVHMYVNKETLILTVIGILLGLPVGRFFSGMLTSVLKMPSIYFAVSIHPITYLFAGGMTFLFALAVDLITNHLLDKINMVDALKSVE